jgi:hypothetical protein
MVILFLVAWCIEMTGQIFTIALIFALFLVAILLELWEIKRIGGECRMKLDEVAGVMQGISDQLAKAKTEILGKIADLEAALTNVELPADATTAIDALKVGAQALDDIVPDA